MLEFCRTMSDELNILRVTIQVANSDYGVVGLVYSRPSSPSFEGEAVDVELGGRAQNKPDVAERLFQSYLPILVNNRPRK